MMELDYDHLFKIVLVGESGVGKSSLILRYMDNSFVDSHMATIGVDFSIRTIDICDRRVKLQLWDTAGQERFRGVTRQFYRSANAVVIVYDLSDEESFHKLPLWLEDVKKYCPEAARLFLIGNKSDLISERAVMTFEGEEFAKTQGMTFFETSAKTGMDVDRFFSSIARMLTEEAKALAVDHKRLLAPDPVRVSGQRVDKPKVECCKYL